MLSGLLYLPVLRFCSRLFRNGSWVLSFCTFGTRICPSFSCMLLFSPLSFLCTLQLERCVQLHTFAALQQRAPDLSYLHNHYHSHSFLGGDGIFLNMGVFFSALSRSCSTHHDAYIFSWLVKEKYSISIQHMFTQAWLLIQFYQVLARIRQK